MYFWFIPRPSSTFQPIVLAAPSPATGEVAATTPQAQQCKVTSLGSLLPCGQGTPTAPTDSHTPVQLDGNTTHQGTPTNKLLAHPQFTHPSVTPQTSPIEQQSPIRMQTNPLSQNSIAAPEATMPDTPEEKMPKSLNGEGVKNSRKQVTTSATNAQDSRLCFRCKQPGHMKKDCPKLPYCSNCRTQGHIPAKCPTKQQDGRQQDERAKMLTKDAKLIGKIGRKHRTDPSSLTEPTNVLTVQVTMEHVIVQQDNNHKYPPPPLATLLVVQIFTKIIHNFKISHLNYIHNKVHPQWAYQPPP